MAGRPIHLLCVGKLKHGFIKEGCGLYQSRLEKWRPLTITCVKDADATLPLKKRLSLETESLVQALSKDAISYLLDERGTSYTSQAFASFLARHDQAGIGTLTFLIGGPFGVCETITPHLRGRITLSAFTLPHELARLLLLEQLYRAESILRNAPYHHA